jgi:hypothetical protein
MYIQRMSLPLRLTPLAGVNETEVVYPFGPITSMGNVMVPAPVFAAVASARLAPSRYGTDGSSGTFFSSDCNAGIDNPAFSPGRSCPETADPETIQAVKHKRTMDLFDIDCSLRSYAS